MNIPQIPKLPNRNIVDELYNQGKFKIFLLIII